MKRLLLIATILLSLNWISSAQTTTPPGVLPVQYPPTNTVPNPYQLAVTNNGQVFVDLNGNDANAVRGRSDYMFSTFSNAVAATKGNDLIVGGVGLFKNWSFSTTNANYFFNPGTTIQPTNYFHYPLAAIGDAILYPVLFSDMLFDVTSYKYYVDNYGAALNSNPYRVVLARTNVIYGAGDFILGGYIPDPVLAATPVILSWYNHSNSVFVFKANSVKGIPTPPSTATGDPYYPIGFIDYGAGYYSVDVNYISWCSTNTGDSHFISPIEYGAGNANFHVNRIEATGQSDCIFIADLPTNPSGNYYGDNSVSTFYGDQLVATNAIYNIQGNRVPGGCCIVWYGNGNITQQQFFNFSDYEAGSGPVLYWTFGGGKVYVSGKGSGKMSNHSNTNAVIVFNGWYNNESAGTNNFWLGGFAKITDNNGGGFLNYSSAKAAIDFGGSSGWTNNANCSYNVNQWEEKYTGYIQAPFRLVAGSHYFGGLTVPVTIPNGGGMYISNAAVTLDNFQIDTSRTSSVSNWCLFITGSGSGTNFVTLSGGKFTASSAANVLDATNAQTVNMVNLPQINGAISANITPVGAWVSNSPSGSTLYVGRTAK